MSCVILPRYRSLITRRLALIVVRKLARPPVEYPPVTEVLYASALRSFTRWISR